MINFIRKLFGLEIKVHCFNCSYASKDEGFTLGRSNFQFSKISRNINHPELIKDMKSVCESDSCAVTSVFYMGYMTWTDFIGEAINDNS